MSLHSEMMSVTFKAKTQKCKPLLGPGVKTAWCKLHNSNKMLTLTQFQAGLDTRKPVTHLHVQWQHTNIRTMFQKKKKFWCYCTEIEQANACIDKTPTRTQWEAKQEFRQPISHLLIQRRHNNLTKTWPFLDLTKNCNYKWLLAIYCKAVSRLSKTRRNMPTKNCKIPLATF